MDNQINTELLQALQGIHAELKRMNQNLATIAAAPAPRSSESAGPSSRPYSSPSRSYSSPSRGPGRSTSGSYSRPSRPAAPPQDGEETPSYGRPSAEGGSRFAKKKSPPRPKGKLPAKKGSGYPKKK